MKLKIPIFLVTVALLLMECSKDEPTKSNPKPPALPTAVTLSGPTSSQAPVEIGTGINTFNAYQGTALLYLQVVGLSEPEVSGNAYVWNSTFSGATVTITAVRSAKNTVDWTVVINGTTTTGTAYNNWTAVTGTTTEDNKSQAWKLYQPNSSTLLLQASWVIDANNVITAILEYPAPISEKQQVIDRPDGSGSYAKWKGTVKVYEAIWVANGTGSYQQWDANGNLISEGSW